MEAQIGPLKVCQKLEQAELARYTYQHQDVPRHKLGQHLFTMCCFEDHLRKHDGSRPKIDKPIEHDSRSGIARHEGQGSDSDREDECGQRDTTLRSLSEDLGCSTMFCQTKNCPRSLEEKAIRATPRTCDSDK